MNFTPVVGGPRSVEGQENADCFQPLVWSGAFSGGTPSVLAAAGGTANSIIIRIQREKGAVFDVLLHELELRGVLIALKEVQSG